jgi:hypothetical protein
LFFSDAVTRSHSQTPHLKESQFCSDVKRIKGKIELIISVISIPKAFKSFLKHLLVSFGSKFFRFAGAGVTSSMVPGHQTIFADDSDVILFEILLLDVSLCVCFLFFFLKFSL